MYGYTWQCMAMHQRPSLIKFLFFQKSALRLFYFAQAREHVIFFFLKGKLLPLEFLYLKKIYKKVANLMYDVHSSSVPIISTSNLFSKSPAFSLVVHVRQHLSSFTQNNLHLIFKERPLHVLVLKAGMRYQLILKVYPKTLLETLFKILESENSYVEVDALINKM